MKYDLANPDSLKLKDMPAMMAVAMMKAERRGEMIEYKSPNGWKRINMKALWASNDTYRVAPPAPKIERQTCRRVLIPAIFDNGYVTLHNPNNHNTNATQHTTTANNKPIVLVTVADGADRELVRDALDDLIDLYSDGGLK